MSGTVTTRDDLLRVSRGLVERDGLSALSMRAVAEGAGVALGTMYNYFPSKSALLEASVESIWRDILPLRDDGRRLGFADEAARLLGDFERGLARYPHFAQAHSAAFSGTLRDEASSRMGQMRAAVESHLRHCLAADPQVRPGALEGGLGADELVSLVWTQLIGLMGSPAGGTEAFVELVRRSIY